MILILGTKNREGRKPDRAEETNESEKERRHNIVQTLCVLSLCPSDIFAHSFEHEPGINISPRRQRNDPWKVSGIYFTFP